MDDFAKTLLVGGICVVLAIPLILRIIPPNPIYGFRTPKTRSSPSIWYPANRYVGWTLLVAGVLSAILAFVNVPAAVAIIGPLTIAVVASFLKLRRMEP